MTMCPGDILNGVYAYALMLNDFPFDVSPHVCSFAC
uniref:Uncharacterized protein n=1 Tax=Arundo donax TaxID=35708 RepID=A0A0A9G1X0_ARUDO